MMYVRMKSGWIGYAINAHTSIMVTDYYDTPTQLVVHLTTLFFSSFYEAIVTITKSLGYSAKQLLVFTTNAIQAASVLVVCVPKLNTQLNTQAQLGQ